MSASRGVLSVLLAAAALAAGSATTATAVPSLPMQVGDVTPVIPAPAVIYEAEGQESARIPPPLRRVPDGAGLQQRAQINVSYSGFSAPAQTAFQHAVDLLEAVFSSSVAIEVEATFAALGPGQLGSAGPTLLYDAAFFPEVATPGFRYPVGLLNHLLGEDFCPSPAGPSCAGVDHDVNATFASGASWYFGTDGNTPPGQIDFVSVVLHEVTHGLGFLAGAYSVAGGSGTRSGLPIIYEAPIETGAGARLAELASPSTALGTALTSNDLFYDGPQAVEAAGGVRPKVYAPAAYSQGSSISHLDEATYPPTNVNALMTPSIGPGQSVHDPGPIGRAILIDMGWQFVPYPSAVPLADFDGSGSSDIAVFRPSNGNWYRIGGPTVQFGAPDDIPVPADYDIDDATEIAVFRPSNGRWYIADTPGSTQFGASTDIPVPADYDNDGDADIAVFRPSNGRWYVNGIAGSVQFGTNGDVPVPGYYDDDPELDLAVFRPSNGRWYVHGTPGSVAFGVSTDRPVPADYDADGRTDIAVFRPSNGRWYIEGVPGSVQYGTSGDIPQPGQYDSDRAIDIAVFRPGNGRWYVHGTGGSVQLGVGSDIPVVLPAALRPPPPA